MRRIKLIFESDKDGDTIRNGYVIDPQLNTYQTVIFDKRYEICESFESHSIGDPTAFGKKLWRLIRIAITNKSE